MTVSPDPPRVPLTEGERAARLDVEIQRYVARGYRLVSRTPTTAQLVKPKEFNVGCAVLGLLFLVIGLFLYLLIYLGEKDLTAYLTVDELGTIQAQGNGVLRVPTVREGPPRDTSGLAYKWWLWVGVVFVALFVVWLLSRL